MENTSLNAWYVCDNLIQLTGLDNNDYIVGGRVRNRDDIVVIGENIHTCDGYVYKVDRLHSNWIHSVFIVSR